MGSDATRTQTIALPQPPVGGDARPSLRVVVVVGPDAGAEFVVASERAVVGRHRDADVTLTDPTVSQFHAELVPTAAGIAIVDLGSRNGTRVGDAQVRDATVPRGALVAVGSTQLRVDLAETFRVECSPGSSFGALVGSSRRMRELFAMLERLARTDLAVLLEGATGTGKELAARALHEHSRRASGPFVAVDCAAIPPTLAESVLFGHEKGAFTGAQGRRAGFFEAADGGTLFLDEIGELPPDLQPKLLGALERRAVTPVGATRAVAVDVRIVSATWRDLRTLVNEGRFREDVYHRLAQARARLPALAERREDIAPLAQHFLAAIPFDVPAARAISDEALEAIAAGSFTGNVRELKNLVERAAMLAQGAVVTLADLAFDRLLSVERGSAPLEAAVARDSLAPPGAPLPAFKDAKQTVIDEFERAYLAQLLGRAGTNISRASRIAGIERPSLRKLLRRHGLRDDD